MIILFDGELNEELGNTVVEQLLDIYTKNQAIIEANDRLKYKSDYLPLYCDTVEFRINSNGGDLFKFIQIWDLIDRLKEKRSEEETSSVYNYNVFNLTIGQERWK